MTIRKPQTQKSQSQTQKLENKKEESKSYEQPTNSGTQKPHKPEDQPAERDRCSRSPPHEVAISVLSPNRRDLPNVPVWLSCMQGKGVSDGRRRRHLRRGVEINAVQGEGKRRNAIHSVGGEENHSEGR